ncbi:TetR/AcrR family transcriptional regulator [Porphyromonas sp.]|uniref:TetR/AcrR family transcriptional regulator n=1 Tax=Porphyromonas sp. TaxID=1924944 RepID=UPI0026DB84B7|nr:TetR family transcriptional regulator [Porphyromonas sp.]MDO4771891.1 TetR family transcriptional regulator [Porphyromonas sp.]
MPKPTTITKDMILEAAFKIVREEGFSMLTARYIAQKIGCSTQPIYWTYKNMNDLKDEVCHKALKRLKDIMCGYTKTGNPFLNLGLGYVYMAHAESALFKAVYIDNVMNIRMTDIFPENQEIVEIMKSSEECRNMSDDDVKNTISKAWMLAHGIASLIATGMLVYDEEKIMQILG